MGLEVTCGMGTGESWISLYMSTIVLCGLEVALGVGRSRIEERVSSEVGEGQGGREHSGTRELLPPSP